MPINFRHWLANVGIAYRRFKAMETFSTLSDAQLSDIGLERHAIEAHVHKSLPWRTPERQGQAALRPIIGGCG